MLKIVDQRTRTHTYTHTHNRNELSYYEVKKRVPYRNYTLLKEPRWTRVLCSIILKVTMNMIIIIIICVITFRASCLSLCAACSSCSCLSRVACFSLLTTPSHLRNYKLDSIITILILCKLEWHIFYYECDVKFEHWMTSDINWFWHVLFTVMKNRSIFVRSSLLAFKLKLNSAN